MRVEMKDDWGGSRNEGQAGLRQLAERVSSLARRAVREKRPDEQLEQSLVRLSQILSLASDSLPERERAKLILALEALARSQETSCRLAFLCLARLGRFGQVLAASLLRDGLLETSEVLEMLAPHRTSVVLGLINQIFLQASTVRGRAEQTALSLLAGAAEADLLQARDFLKATRGSRPGLAYPLREALWEGRIGRDIRAVDPAVAKVHQLKEILDWLSLIRPEESSSWLSAGLADRGLAALACRVMSAEPRPGPGLGRTLSQLLATATGSDAASCVDAARTVVPEKAASVASALFRNRPESKAGLVGALSKFAPEAFRDFLGGLSPVRRDEASSLVLGRVAMEDARGVWVAAVAAGEEELAAVLFAQGRAAPGAREAGLDLPPEVKAAAPDAGDSGNQQERSAADRGRDFNILGFLGLGQGKSKDSLASLAPAAAPARGEEVSGRAFFGESYRPGTMTGVRYARCRFEGVSFSRATLDKVVFDACEFSGCFFDDAVLRECSFRGGALRSCVFDGAVIESSHLEGLEVGATTFAGARFHKSRIGHCRMESCDFSGLAASELKIQGALLAGCLLDRARLWQCSLEAVECQGVQARRARAWDVSGFEPLLAGVEAKTLKDSLSEAGTEPSVQLRAEGDRITAALLSWLGRQESLRALRAHLAENARRRDFGRRTLGPEKARFTSLLPLLLHSGFFDRAAGLYPLAPPCRVALYHPDPEALALAGGHFPDVDHGEDNPDALVIEGLYTIGSFGTLAQTERSDLDMWVLIRAAQAAETDLEGLQLKLTALENFALESYGLEVHFYLMDLERVAANDFGASHEEGSGSAQAMLLKEEFYRTAVLLAGKPPLWWAAQPGCDEESWRALAADPDFSTALIDLGRIGDIPRAEYFGGALWQIFKSIAAPYKSVMKIALLERYATQVDGRAGLLCEAIKADLLSGVVNLWALDPYARLFSEVHAHYKISGFKEEAAILGHAFLSKSELAIKARAVSSPLSFEESQIRRMYFCKEESAFCFGGKGGAVGGGYREQSKVAELLSRFIVRAYTRLSDQLKALPGSAITPEDLTRLGRRVMAAFSKRKYKVEITPFAETLSRACEVIYVSATRGEKNIYVWRIQAGQSVPGETRLEIVISRESRDLAAELVWLMANRVFGAGTQVSADYTINPVTARDIQDIMEALHGFFPQDALHTASTADALNPEAVAKAFVVANLTEPRENRQLKELIVVYQTTWGELFVRTAHPKNQPPYDPRALIKAVSGMECVENLEIDWRLPARAACPSPFGAQA